MAKWVFGLKPTDTGDPAHIDEDGYVWFPKHPAVAESGVIGRPEELRGEVISAFVLLKNGFSASAELKKESLERDPGDLTAIEDEGSVTERRIGKTINNPI